MSLIVDPEPKARELVAAKAASSALGEPVSVGRLTWQVLRDAAPDAVIIASPSGLHFEQAVLALSCGLPTFVEKPLACTATHGRILQTMGDGLLVVAEQRTHRTDLRLVRSLIEADRLGEILSIEYGDSISPSPTFAESWRNDLWLAGGGVLTDLGYHTIGALQWLLGDIVDIVDRFSVVSAKLSFGTLKVECRARVRCTFGGIETFLDIGLAEDRPQEVLRVRGSTAEVRVARSRRNKLLSTITVRRAGRLPTSVRARLDPLHDIRALENFLAGTSGPHHLARHVRTLELISSMYEKANERLPRCS